MRGAVIFLSLSGGEYGIERMRQDSVFLSTRCIYHMSKISISADARIWGIHSRVDSLFLNKGVIAVGWKELGDVSGLPATREAFKRYYAKVYPDAGKQSVANSSGTLYRFVHELKVGDWVLFPESSTRRIHFGHVTGEYVYSPEDGEYVQQRSVEWVKMCPREHFSQGALYELGAAMAFFSVKNFADEFTAALSGSLPKETPPDFTETTALTAEAVAQRTRDYLFRVLLTHFKGYELEPLVADLLRAMGYRTQVSPRGGDHGIDIVVYQDELQLPPRVVVQCKTKAKAVTEAEVQAFCGAKKPGEFGFYVSLYGYAQNALAYLEHRPEIRAIDGDSLMDLLLAHYEKLSPKFRRLVPLKKVYIPVPADEQE